MREETILLTLGLKKYYPIRGGVFTRKIGEVKAVDNVSIDIKRGECFGLVGESGCGKTTFGKTVIRLLKPTSGHIYFEAPNELLDGIQEIGSDPDPKLADELEKYDIARYKGSELKALRRKMQIVYQDPTSSLNPRMLVKDIVEEPLKVQGIIKDKKERREKVLEILYKVGLTEDHLYRYPHEFSGGQRQRIAIARALVINPEFVVLDEPTSSVDVSVRAQLLDLFQYLKNEMNLTYLFISHDLSVIECISDRVAVMYLGKIVELASTRDLFHNQFHPYSKALISSVPIPDPTAKRKRILLRGEVPSPVNPPKGCRFHPRCWKAKEICSKEEPKLVDIKDGHFVACHFPEVDEV